MTNTNVAHHKLVSIRSKPSLLSVRSPACVVTKFHQRDRAPECNHSSEKRKIRTALSDSIMYSAWRRHDLPARKFADYLSRSRHRTIINEYTQRRGTSELNENHLTVRPCLHIILSNMYAQKLAGCQLRPNRKFTEKAKKITVKT